MHHHHLRHLYDPPLHQPTPLVFPPQLKKYALYVLSNPEVRDTRLSDAERVFVGRYADLKEEHFRASALSQLEERMRSLEEPDMSAWRAGGWVVYCTRARVCMCAGVRVCGCAGVRVCGCAGVRVCGCAGVRVCVYAWVWHVCGMRVACWRVARWVWRGVA